MPSIAAESAASPAGDAPAAFERLIAELASGLIVSAGDDLDAGIERALERIVGFYPADRSTLFRLATTADDDRESTRPARDMVATHSWAREGIARLAGVFGSESFPWALDAVLRGESIELDTLAPRPPEAAVDLASCRRWSVRRVIATPLVSAGRVVGALAIGQVREQRAWRPSEQAQLATVAGLFASAVARRQSHQALMEIKSRLDAAQSRFRHAAAAALHAQEDERRRIARDLHDDVVQRLVSLSLSLELSGADPAIAVDARAIAATVHGLSRSLHPRLVESLGLRGAVEAEVASFLERFPGSATVRFAMDSPRGDDAAATLAGIAPEIAAVAYRVLQESLRNVLRHANAARVEIACTAEPNALRLTVEDDGRGFAASAAATGLGLVSMQERVALAGGEIRFGRSPLGGASVEVTIRLDAPAAEASP